MPDNNDSGGGFWAELFKNIPFRKLRRYEVANLLFEAVAVYFTLHYRSPQDNPAVALCMWIVVILLGFICILWACKQ
jgi:hypothetical protein